MGNKNIFDEEDKNHIQAEYDSLINNLHRCNKPGDRELIEKAFKVANEAHWNMRRMSGDPYILHPIAVAKIVNQEIGLGAKSIAVALLHDVVEDTEYSLEDVQRDFGEKIASLIDGLTKISGAYNKESSSSMQAENFRKMLLTLSDDLRVILIKIADRLHNMRTLDSMPEHKKMKVAGAERALHARVHRRIAVDVRPHHEEDGAAARAEVRRELGEGAHHDLVAAIAAEEVRRVRRAAVARDERRLRDDEVERFAHDRREHVPRAPLDRR